MIRSNSHCCSAAVSRRGFLADLGMGFAGLALGAMLQRDGVARGDEGLSAWSAPDGRHHFRPKAKNVIWLFMIGGTSHLESFDPKPALNEYAGKSIDETPYKDALSKSYVENVRIVVPNDANGHIWPKVYPLQVGWRKQGESGIEVSDWWPQVATCIDDISFVRSMWTTDNDHAAQLQFHTGRHVFEGFHPTVGAWVHYALGALTDNLPQFDLPPVRSGSA